MSSSLMLRTLARSSGLAARPLSTTPARFADDKSMYDKVKDKAGERHTSFKSALFRLYGHAVRSDTPDLAVSEHLCIGISEAGPHAAKKLFFWGSVN